MKSKALLIAASLLVAAISNSTAQVHSVNIVGYVNASVPQARGTLGSYAILANPLNANPDNSLNTVLPLPQDGTFDGANVFRFNRATQMYRETMQFVSGAGWLAADPADLIVNPGEGFFVQNVANIPLPITFIGEVPMGTLTQVIEGGNKYNLISSIVPKAQRPGFVGNPNTFQIPACDGDNIFIFDPDCQCYKETYQYIDSVGWLHPTDTDPGGPLIAPGTGFWLQRACQTAGIWWQTFSVNE